MTPIQHSQYYHLPPSEGTHNRFDLHPSLPIYEPSSFPCATLRNPCQGEPHESDHPHIHQPRKADEHLLSGGSTGHSGPPTSPPVAEDDDSRKKNATRESDPSKRGSVNWVSSKMKLVRKMMNPDRITNSNPKESMLQAQDHQQSIRDNNSSKKNDQCLQNGIIRVCSDCNTTKTPLWRSGPRGPKSLCNACGIRQRKARRAMAAAAGLIPAVGPARVRKEKISDGERTLPFKKRCKFTSPQTPKKLHFDDFATNLIKNSAFQRVFPQDEKEAAILLMALSCGLICG